MSSATRDSAMHYAPAYVAALASGALAGALARLSKVPFTGALLVAWGAVLGALLLRRLRADSGNAAGSTLGGVPTAWLIALVLFCGATYGAATWLGGSASKGNHPNPEAYPALSELLEINQATPDELTLLYQIRWALMRQQVPVSEMSGFFKGVVEDLRRTHADERVLALRHVLINMDAGAAERLNQSALPYPPDSTMPRGFLPPPPGSCGGTCGSGGATEAGPVTAPAPAVAPPAGGSSASCGGGGSCG